MSELKNSSFRLHLPEDPIPINQPRQVENSCFSLVAPEQKSDFSFAHINPLMLEELSISLHEKNWNLWLSGQSAPPGIDSFAMNYGGHQFGHWAGQLGDGRALNIGELDGQNLQLKGAGKTPYSRKGDGKAVVRSSIREYLMSEAMYHLGIPTTRSLSFHALEEKVERDLLYNGNVQWENAAVICRVAKSFIRFGNFEIHAARKEWDTLRKLVDYTIHQYFPEISSTGKNRYLDFYKEICQRTLNTVLHWQRVGFVHGVLNTDNMSILGLTIDYGPYGFLDNYDPNYTPNLTDFGGRRYRFENQPMIAQWNLWKLANALFHLIEDAPALEEELQSFQNQYHQSYMQMMREKLGLFDSSIPNEFIHALEENLQRIPTDYTLFFTALGDFHPDKNGTEIISESFYTLPSDKILKHWENWFHQYQEFIEKEMASKEERIEKMQQVNPRYILRNFMLYEAIEKFEQGDYSLFLELFEMQQSPYSKNEKWEKWRRKKPDWADDTPGSSVLSCSS